MVSSRGSQFLFSLLVIILILASAPQITPQSATQGILDASSRLSQQPDKPQTKEEAEALRLLKESRELRDQGRLDEAIATGERALRACAAAVSSDPLCSAVSEANLAQLYLKKGDLARAESLYIQAAEVFETQLGPKQFDAVGLLVDLAETFWRLGDKARGLRTYEHALTAQERKLGPEHPDVAKTLDKLGAAYRDVGNYVLAEQRYKRALIINEKLYGADHQGVGWALNSLGGLYRVMGEYDLSLQCYKRALAIFEKALGTENATVATVLDNLGLVYQEQNKLDLAEQAHKRALATFEKMLGPDNLDVAIASGNLAEVYARTGNYDRAEQFYRRELTIKEKQLGTAHPNYANTLDNFANLYQRKLDYKTAEQLHKRALAIYINKLGPGSLDVAIALSNLASLYLDEADYAQAELMYQQALAIRVNSYGEKHPDVVRTLIEMGDIYRLKGDYPSAMRDYKHAFAIAKTLAEVDDPAVGDVLEGVADIYSRLGDLSPAEQLYKRALEIHRKVFGHDSPSVLDSLASIYIERGDFSQAERLFQQTLNLRLKGNGEDSTAVAASLIHLAGIHHLRGQYDQAEQMYQRAKAIYEKKFGSNYYVVAAIDFPLGLIAWAKGNIPLAAHLLTHADDMVDQHLTRILPTGSENQKKLFVINNSPMTHATLSFNALSAPLDPGATRLGLATVLRRKGRVLDAMTDEMGALRRRLGPQDRTLFDQLRLARSRYAARALKTEGVDPGGGRVEMLKLQDQIELLEAQVGRHSSKLRTEVKEVTVEGVQRALPAGAALIEIVAFTTYNPKTKSYDDLYGAERYAAYVLKREGDPALIDLGETAPIDRAAARLRKSLRDAKSTDTESTSRALDELVMRPVRKHLGDVRMILLSPDGALNLVPFGALVDEQGRYLIESYTINYLTSGRDLLRLQVQGESGEPPRVFADPLYDLTTSGQQQALISQANSSATLNANNQRSKDFPEQTYPPLPGTAAEGDAISHLFPDAILLTQAKATEAALKKVNRPYLLHIATHGFFFSDQSEVLPAGNRMLRGTLDTMEMSLSSRSWENPLLRSGLVLAGVKQGMSGADEDGVLSALELAGLDLLGTKLVVLSSCETGLGDVQNGEGVYGLRRALVLSGSETQVMSLWKVSDAGTRDLMTAYYTRLKNGEGRAEALRQVQLAMLRGQLKFGGGSEKRGTTDTLANTNAKDYRHPYYWAAFIESGDWRNLNGK